MAWLHLLAAVKLVCQSPLKHAPQIPNATLRSIALVTRHGMRTPVDSYYRDENQKWECDAPGAKAPKMSASTKNGVHRRFQQELDSRFTPFPPNCDGGELLTYGMNQHFDLGRFYRSYLVDELQFLPKFLDPNLVNIRSSRVERCIKSAQSFLNGFYPAERPGESFSIETGSNRREVLYPATEECEDMQELWNRFAASPEFQDRRQKSEALYEKVFEQFGIVKNEVNWMFLGDYLVSLQCANQTLPDIITDEIMLQGVKDIAYFSYGHDSYNHERVAGSSIWRRILKDFDRDLALEQHVGRFRMYSAHDTTIAALLVHIGFYDEELPPFRSHLAIELWDDGSDYIFRVVFNGEEMPIDLLDNQKRVGYRQFKQAIAPYLKKCLKEFPE